MSFDVAADAYDAYMGRYSRLLAPLFAEFAGVQAGQRGLDVGCGPGALTGELVRRLGADAVTAVDPSPPFVAAVGERFPGVHVLESSAEALPFADATFDITLAQLVVHFMRRPIEGIAEMRRVSRPGGVVAACVWDFGGERTPLSTFWRAARDVDPDSPGEAHLPGTHAGELTRIFEAAGLMDVSETDLCLDARHATFDEWWQPYTQGVGPGGAYVAGLDDARREALRERCRELLGEPPIIVHGCVWAASGRV